MSYRYLRPIISLAVAAAALPLAFGQNPSSTAQGDVFNSTTRRQACWETYRQTARDINEASLLFQAQSRKAQAACKFDQGCVRQVQQRRIAYDESAGKQLDSAKAELNACEKEPGESPQYLRKGVPLKGGVEENIQPPPSKQYNPDDLRNNPTPAAIAQPGLKGSAQADRGLPQPYKGTVRSNPPSGGREMVTVDWDTWWKGLGAQAFKTFKLGLTPFPHNLTTTVKVTVSSSGDAVPTLMKTSGNDRFDALVLQSFQNLNAAFPKGKTPSEKEKLFLSKRASVSNVFRVSSAKTSGYSHTPVPPESFPAPAR
jgi:hypothetical protein